MVALPKETGTSAHARIPTTVYIEIANLVGVTKLMLYRPPRFMRSKMRVQ